VRQQANFRGQREELDASQRLRGKRYVEARKRATEAVIAAREAYRKAGGTE